MQSPGDPGNGNEENPTNSRSGEGVNQSEKPVAQKENSTSASDANPLESIDYLAKAQVDEIHKVIFDNSMSGNQKEEMDTSYAAAVDLYEGKEYAKAIDQLLLLYSVDQEDNKLLRALGHANFQLGNYVESEKYFIFLKYLSM